MKNYTPITCLAAVILFMAVSTPAKAQPHYWDQGSTLTYYMQQGYGFSKQIISTVGKMIGNNDDASICFRIAKERGLDPRIIMGMRRKGLSWQKIMDNLSFESYKLFEKIGIMDGMGVPPSYRDTFRKYDKWKKEGGKLILTDDDVRDLVQLRFCTVTFGVPIGDVFKARKHHDSWTSVILNQGRP